jgi:hypothetical protein
MLYFIYVFPFSSVSFLISTIRYQHFGWILCRLSLLRHYIMLQAFFILFKLWQTANKILEAMDEQAVVNRGNQQRPLYPEVVASKEIFEIYSAEKVTETNFQGQRRLFSRKWVWVIIVSLVLVAAIIGGVIGALYHRNSNHVAHQAVPSR